MALAASERMTSGGVRVVKRDRKWTSALAAIMKAKKDIILSIFGMGGRLVIIGACRALGAGRRSGTARRRLLRMRDWTGTYPALLHAG